jgi:hypothetical protein
MPARWILISWLLQLSKHVVCKCKCNAESAKKEFAGSWVMVVGCSKQLPAVCCVSQALHSKWQLLIMQQGGHS